MSLFDFLKKDKVKQSINDFESLWNVQEISNIWEIEDKNDFMVALNGCLCRKCAYGDELQNLSNEEKTVYLCQTFESEINNGGFSQFFYNSSGDYTAETIKALKEIGALKTVAIFQKAISIFPHSIVPQDRDERSDLLDTILNDEVNKVLECADKEFYRYEDNLLDLSYSYVQSSAAHFK